MTNQTFNVSIEFIIDALQSRYDNVKHLWGGDASHALWEQALQMVEECGIGENITSPSIFVDNYLINGEFVDKELDVSYWLDYDADELTEEELQQKWAEYCENNAMLYDDEYACLGF